MLWINNPKNGYLCTQARCMVASGISKPKKRRSMQQLRWSAKHSQTLDGALEKWKMRWLLIHRTVNLHLMMIIRTNGGQCGDWAPKRAVTLQTETPKVGAQCHSWTRALRGRHFCTVALQNLEKNWELCVRTGKLRVMATLPINRHDKGEQLTHVHNKVRYF